jgi:hypothetical protein
VNPRPRRPLDSPQPALHGTQDFKNLGDFLMSIAPDEGPGRDRGTPAERVHTFECEERSGWPLAVLDGE